ncbi:MAG: response regulator transcription factor [Chloroflexi bacterium]|nr:response regulator transcription factor [Chloroflexota bacterium]
MHVLLVDDHALFLEGIRNLLASEGIQVVGTARDGLEALSQARRLRPDVILMDVQMPRCNGLSATRLIKAEMPQSKIVILTMSEDEQDLFDAVKSGASGYLLKRLDADQFFAYLADLEAGHLPFSPGLAAKLLSEFTRLSAQQAQEPASPPESTPPGQARQAEAGALSPRQMQILTLVAQGQTYRQVAETIGIAERTVKYHMGEILERLHLANRAQVIAYAAQMGFVRPEQD